VIGARRHEIHHRRSAFARFELRFQNEGVAAIAPAHRALDARRRDAPAAVLGLAEERGEARRGIEARPAQPVERAVARDERGGVAVADQRVVFNPHALLSPRVL
jgi:hypothetical protein